MYTRKPKENFAKLTETTKLVCSCFSRSLISSNRRPLQKHQIATPQRKELEPKRSKTGRDCVAVIVAKIVILFFVLIVAAYCNGELTRAHFLNRASETISHICFLPKTFVLLQNKQRIDSPTNWIELIEWMTITTMVKTGHRRYDRNKTNDTNSKTQDSPNTTKT